MDPEPPPSVSDEAAMLGSGIASVEIADGRGLPPNASLSVCAFYGETRVYQGPEHVSSSVGAIENLKDAFVWVVRPGEADLIIQIRDQNLDVVGMLVLGCNKVSSLPDNYSLKRWCPLQVFEDGRPVERGELSVSISFQISQEARVRRAEKVHHEGRSVSMRRRDFFSKTSASGPRVLAPAREASFPKEIEKEVVKAKNTGYVGVANWESPSSDEGSGADSSSSSQAGRSSSSSLPNASMSASDDVPSITRGNDRFQQLQHFIASTGHMQGESLRLLKLYEEVHTIAQDFAGMASHYGHIIISELHLPVAAKSIKPTIMGGSLGGQKYIVHNIMFKVPEAALFKDYPDPMWASMKVAGHELKGLKCFSSYYMDQGLLRVNLPMAAVIDSRGHRLLAVSVLPISRETLCYGSDNAGTYCDVVRKDLALEQVVSDACKYLGLKKHAVVNGINSNRTQMGEAEVAGPIDLEGHKGLDGRYYLVDFSRTMPPLWENDRREYDRNWHYYKLMRSEFLMRYSKPLNPDAFSRFSSLLTSDRIKRAVADQVEIKQATEFLLTTHMVATARNMLAYWKEHGETVGSFSLSQKMHFYGINMRYLGILYEAMRTTFTELELVSAVQLMKWIKCEALARVGKNTLRGRLRNAHQAQMYLGSSHLVATTIGFCAEFIGIVDNNVWKSQNGIIMDDLQELFSFSRSNAERAVETFLNEQMVLGRDLSITARGFVLQRICEMTAINIIPEVMNGLKQGRMGFKGRILSLAAPDVKFGNRVKHLNIVEYAKAFILYQQGLGANDPMTKMSYFHRAHTVLADSLNSPQCSVKTLSLAGDICLRHMVAVASTGTDKEAGEDVRILAQMAKDYFKVALEVDPLHLPSMCSLAELLSLSKDFLAAEELFLKALELAPHDETTLLKYAYFLKKDLQLDVEANRIMERYLLVQSNIIASAPLFEDEFLLDLEPDQRLQLLVEWKAMMNDQVKLLLDAYVAESWVQVVDLSHAAKGACQQIGAAKASVVLNRIYVGAKADIPIKSNILDAIQILRQVLQQTYESLKLP